MPDRETILLTPQTDDEILASVDQLYADRQVGGFVLKSFVDPTLLPSYTVRGGKGLQHHPDFKRVAEQITQHMSGPEGTYETSNTGGFSYGHPWHLAMERYERQLRFWVHLSGNATFSISRAANMDVDSCYDIPDESVLEDSYATPVIFRPEPGDILAFIDKGCIPLGAPSSFHKVDVPRGQELERLSTAYDLIFSS